MDQATRLRLNDINRAFYAQAAAEFDATRRRAWQGWRRALDYTDSPLQSVIDIGCGNARFADFLWQRQKSPFAYSGIDNSPALLGLAHARLRQLERVEARLIARDLVIEPLDRSEIFPFSHAQAESATCLTHAQKQPMPGMPAQLVTLFGLLHHVPGRRQRRELLARCADLVAPGGYLIFAAWRFYEEARFRARIQPWNEQHRGLPVEAHDYLLDWRRGERGLRYCHYVDDAEHEDLVAATGLTTIADFRADGASGALNRYSVLKRASEG